MAIWRCIHIIVYIYNSFLSTAELNPLCEHPTVCLPIHYWKILELFPALDIQSSSVQSLSHVRPYGLQHARPPCPSPTPRVHSDSCHIESVMPSSHLILCRPLLLLPPIPPSIRVFSNESALRMRWPKYWSFSFSIIPSKEIPGLISLRVDWLDLLAVQGIGIYIFEKLVNVRVWVNISYWKFYNWSCSEKCYRYK